MKRKLIFLLLMAAAAVGAQAQTKMYIHQKSGGNIEIAFADKPEATYEGEEIVITTTKALFRFPLSNLDSITYDEVGSDDGIESITQLSPDAGPSRVYDINGRLIKTVPAGEPVGFGTLPQGTYIIKNNYSSYKINKK